ncbi:MAG: BatD family protein [Desulfobacteraceae bacterium]|nr:BatD family protein [Desulfobacteraceae bacterium]
MRETCISGRWRRWLVFGLMAAALLGLGACVKPPAPAAARRPAVSREFKNGPLTLTLTLDRQRLTVAEHLRLELRAEADESYSLRLAKLPDLPGLSVVSSSQSPPEMGGEGKVRVNFRLLLDPQAPGEWRLPALTIEAWGQGGSPVATVSSEPVTVRVDSLLAPGEQGVKLADIAPPVLPPFSPWLLAGLGVAMAGLLLAGFWGLRRWRRRSKLPPPFLPPHLAAYRALDELLAADLLGRGEGQVFYDRLSGILRRYIEARFGLKAPERTTEEFLLELREVRGGPMAEPANARLLAEFLAGCDLVKFANRLPSRPEAEAALELCRRFVGQTEPQEDGAGTGAGI